MNLKQGLKFSRLSSVPVDGCTFAPELGVTVYCKMHDHLLIHLSSRTRPINREQFQFLLEEGFDSDFRLTRLQSDRLFREGLGQKVKDTNGLRSIGYYAVQWLYYIAVRMRSILLSNV